LAILSQYVYFGIFLSTFQLLNKLFFYFSFEVYFDYFARVFVRNAIQVYQQLSAYLLVFIEMRQQFHIFDVLRLKFN